MPDQAPSEEWDNTIDAWSNSDSDSDSNTFPTEVHWGGTGNIWVEMRAAFAAWASHLNLPVLVGFESPHWPSNDDADSSRSETLLGEESRYESDTDSENDNVSHLDDDDDDNYIPGFGLPSWQIFKQYLRTSNRAALSAEEATECCGVCQEKWNDSTTRSVCLPLCRHLICRECAELWFSPTASIPGDNTDSCPHCRQVLFRREQFLLPTFSGLHFPFYTGSPDGYDGGNVADREHALFDESAVATQYVAMPSGSTVLPVASPLPHPNSVAFGNRVSMFNAGQGLDITSTATTYGQYIRLPPVFRDGLEHIDMTAPLSADEASAALEALSRHYQQRWGFEMFPETLRGNSQRVTILAHPMCAWTYSIVLEYLRAVQNLQRVDFGGTALGAVQGHLLLYIGTVAAPNAVVTEAVERLLRSIFCFAGDVMRCVVDVAIVRRHLTEMFEGWVIDTETVVRECERRRGILAALV